MKILIAEDDADSRRVLTAVLSKWGHEVISTNDGVEALAALHDKDAPRIAILDVMMPNMGGIEVCRYVRELGRPTYIILLTALNGKDHVMAGIESGADDYVTKPFDSAELRVRIHAGQRAVELQQTLADRVQELEEALAKVKLLQGLIPICSYCKSIRDDQNYWQELEGYLGSHSEARFSHGICPTCFEQFVQPDLARLHKPRVNEGQAASNE